MKKLMYLFVIVLFSQVFFSCSTDYVNEDSNPFETIQNADGDWGDEIDDFDDEEDEENNEDNANGEEGEGD